MTKPNSYPDLPGDEARKRIAEDRFDRLAEKPLRKALAPQEHPAKRAERERVKAMIERDKADYAAEIAREAAQIEVREGVYVNLADSTIEPTPEWKAQVAHRTFVPDQPKGTVRTIRGVRRELTPAVVKMCAAGKLSDEQAAACLWFRKVFDQAALDGRYSSMQYTDTSSATSRKLASFAGHIPMTLTEAEARRAYRAAKESIPQRNRRFFEAVVLGDKSLRAARPLAKCRASAVPNLFRKLAQRLLDHCENHGVDFANIDKQNAGD
jgi:hypothetical protein